MALSRVHTWVAGEVLLASDQNAEFNNILGNAADLVSPFTKAISMGGFALNYDALNTMSLTSSTKGLNLSSTTAINDVFTTVASAATPDIWTAVGGVVNYTGTVTATGFAAAPQAGARRTLVCTGAAPFTAGANVLIDGYASGATYTAAAGDKVHIIAVSTTQFRLTPAIYTATQALTDAATISWDTSLGAVGTVTLAASRTMAAPTNLRAGGRYVLIITQDGTGGRVLTWNAVFKGQGGAVMPQPDTTLSAVTVFTFDSDGTNLYTAQSTPFIDTNYIVRGSADATKKMRFEVDGLTTATTRVLTVPNFDLTLGQVGVKVGLFTRNLTTASGTLAVTGVGFTPKAVVFVSAMNPASPAMSVGVDDGTSSGCVSCDNADSADTFIAINPNSIALVTAAGAYQQGAISSLDADGFTLTWVKVGSPTGTASMTYLAFR